MKLNGNKEKLTLVIIPEAGRAVIRFQLPKMMLYLLPAAVICLFAVLLSLYLLQAKTSGLAAQLEAELSAKEKEWRETERASNQTIEQLQNEVIMLTQQANNIENKMSELRRLENELKQWTKGADKPVQVASLHSGEGGRFIPVHNDDILALADKTYKRYAALDEEIDALINDLRAVKKEAEAYQELLRMTPTIWPVDSRQVTSAFGYRQDPFTLSPSFHSGLDIAAPLDTAVYATADGTVSEAGYGSANGNYIVIRHGNGIQTKYLHLNKILVKPGKKVKKGQKIGLVGSTGRSTGPHLHYEVIKNGKTVDPETYIFSAGRGEL